MIRYWLLCGLLLNAVANLARPEPPPGVGKVKTDVVYAKRGNQELKLDAYLPKGKGPFPAVMLVHGGAWRFGGKWQLTHQGLYLARRGYAAFSISYRLAPRDKFPAQVDDCRDALKWIRSNAKTYQVDAARVAGAGYSAGGHLVCLLAVTGQPPSKENGNIDTRLQAVIAGGAPCELRNLPKSSPELSYWLGGSRAQKPENYRLASPNAFASKAVPPTFFYNGTIDAVVPFAWTEPYYKTLKKLGVPTEMYRVKDAGHMTAFLHPESFKRACAFIDPYMKKKAAKSESK